jgi:hypothetical protein
MKLALLSLLSFGFAFAESSIYRTFEDLLSKTSLIKFDNGTAGRVDLNGNVALWAKQEFVDGHLAVIKGLSLREFEQVNIARHAHAQSEVESTEDDRLARRAGCVNCATDANCQGGACVGCVGSSCAVIGAVKARDLCDYYYC